MKKEDLKIIQQDDKSWEVGDGVRFVGRITLNEELGYIATRVTAWGTETFAFKDRQKAVDFVCHPREGVIDG